MIKIDLAGASAMNESYSVIENQGYVAAFVDRTILKNVTGPRDESIKEIVSITYSIDDLWGIFTISRQYEGY